MKALLVVSVGLLIGIQAHAIKLTPKQLKEMTTLKNACKARSSGDCFKAGVKVWNMSGEAKHKELARKLFRKSCRLGEVTACEFTDVANTASIDAGLAKGRGLASPKK